MSRFKIECDALTREDCQAAANVIAPRLNAFSSVEAVPSTGPISRWLASALMPYVSHEGSVLICDDVFTTGASMEAQRNGRNDVQGAVIFARGPLPEWVTALFTCSVP